MSGSEAITARFGYDETLLRALERMTAERRSVGGALAVGVWAAVIVSFAFLVNSFSVYFRPITMLDLAALAIGLAIVWGLLRVWASQRRRRLLNSSPYLQTETAIHIDADGVRVETLHATTHYQWSAIVDVMADKDAVGLFFGPTIAVAIPASALDRSPKEAAAAIEAWRRAAPFA